MTCQISCTCSDSFGTWKSVPSSNIFQDFCDADAIAWAKKEIARLRNHFSDIKFENVSLIDSDLNGFNDRIICTDL